MSEPDDDAPTPSGTGEHASHGDGPAAVDSTMLLGTLVPDPHNRRRRTARNVEMITQSLREVGPGRSIVIDEHDEIIAGNGVVEAAPAAGVTKVRVVDAQPDELIAVRRRGLSDEQKRAMAIYDNRTAELAEWDAEQLQADADAGLTLAPYWTDEELVEMELRDPDYGPVDAETQGRLDIKRQITCPHCGAMFEV
jgi:ParB-like chromosome segregation protein Spo0J